MTPTTSVDTIVSHLGGNDILAQLGTRNFFSDDNGLSFQLSHANPNDVSSVIISKEARGFYTMECYSKIPRGTLTAPLVGKERKIIPENLASVFGRLTGIQGLQHHHY